MRTEVLALPRLREFDNPWRRLPWTLPLALLIWAAILWAFAVFTEKPRQRLPESPPIEAQVIELPPEPPAPAPPQAEPPPVPAQPRVVTPPRQPRPKVAPPPQAAATAPNPPPAPAAETAPTTPAPPVRATPPPTPRPEPAASGGNNLSASGGAQAIVRPMPQIPDDLREEALHVVALARFHVAADGNATVELARPTPNPRLNRLLLETLKQWKFFPAMRDGQPVASTEEIAIRIEVK